MKKTAVKKTTTKKIVQKATVVPHTFMRLTEGILFSTNEPAWTLTFIGPRYQVQVTLTIPEIKSMHQQIMKQAWRKKVVLSRLCPPIGG